MAVQQNKKSPSKRGMHRAHDFLTNPPLAVEPTTGEVHLRHHITRAVTIAARRSSRPGASRAPPGAIDRTALGSALPLSDSRDASHRASWKSP